MFGIVQESWVLVFQMNRLFARNCTFRVIGTVASLHPVR